MLLEELSDIAANLRMMGDDALAAFANTHKSDPYMFALAVSESTQRKKLRAAQAAPITGPMPTVADSEISQMGGIAQLPARNMEMMADGGIVGGVDDGYDMAVGYGTGGGPGMAGGGMVERYQRGGDTSPKNLFEKALDAEGVTDPVERAFLRSVHMQESGGKERAPTSNRGARGPMQVLPTTFSQVADKGMDINNPVDNMRAGIRYARQGFQASGGDPVLAGAYYYGGPGGMAKAAKGEAVADPKNPNAPTTIDYGKQVAARMTQLLPVGAAQAAQPTPVVDREKLISQIPGQTAAGRTTAPEPERRLTDYIFGAGETGLATLTGALSPVTGGARKLMQEALYGKSDPMEDQMARYTFAPRGEAGQAMTQELGRFLTQDMKLPPYIPALGGATPRGSVPRTAAAADEAAAVAAREATPRLPSPTTPATPGGKAQGIAALQQQKGTADAAARASAAAQQEAAAARIAAERAGAVNAELPGAANRAGLAGLAGVGASAAGEPPPSTEGAAAERPDDGSYKRMEDAKFIRQAEEARAASERMREIAEIKKDAPPEVKKEAKKEGWGPEDWLVFGATLAGTRGSFAEGISKAALTTVGARREREKGETEREYKEALKKQAERPAAEIQLIERLQTDPKFAAAYERYASTKREPMTREKAMTLWGGSMLLQTKYPNFEDFAKIAMSGMQGAAGPKLSSSDLALIQSYLR